MHFARPFAWRAASLALPLLVCWLQGTPCRADYDDASVEEAKNAKIASREPGVVPKVDGPSFAGTYTGKALTLKLRRAGGGNAVSMYLGTLTIDGAAYFVTAAQKGESLTGSFGALNAKPNDQFKFTASIDGDALTLTSDKQDFSLRREAAVNEKVRPPQSLEKPAVIASKEADPAEVEKSQIDEIERLRAIVMKDGDGKAAVQLGDLFAKEQKGIESNPFEACIWYSVADDLDDPTAAAKNQAISDQLTEAQLTKVDARAQAIVKKIKEARGASSGEKKTPAEKPATEEK